MKITILTPIYNRAYIIRKLYDSLVNQTETNFKWLIVDDGSKDNLIDVIKDFINENKIEIEYVHQENGGKHRALNTGILKVSTDMVFIVDSDDYLTPDAIETINKYYEKYKNDKEICGFSFLRKYPNGDINGEKFPKDEYRTDYITARINKNILGDKAEIYFTDCLRKFPFLEIENEKFLFEDYVWIQLGEKYKTIHINQAIYVGEYLRDGLTKNMTKVKLSSPKGMSARGLKLCSKKCNLKTREKGMLIYIGYGLIARYRTSELFKKCNYKFLFIINYISGRIFYQRLKAKQKNRKELKE